MKTRPRSSHLRRAVVGLVLFAVATTVAATPMPVIRYGELNGLSGHIVTGIATDRDQRLWVATLGGGAFRFDGLRWTQFGARGGLLGDDAVALVRGNGGEMWVSTAGAGGSPPGLSVIHGDAVLPPIVGELWEASTGLVTADGVVWIAFRSGGVGRYADNVLEPIAGLESMRVTRIIQDLGGDLWMMGRPIGGDLTSRGALYRYFNSRFHRQGGADGVPSAPLRDLMIDRDGALWLASGDGLYHRGGRQFSRPEVVGATTERSLHSVSQDQHGRIWAGGDGMVLRLEGRRCEELRLPVELVTAPVLEVVGSPLGGVFARTPTHLLRLEGHTAEILLVEPVSGAFADDDGTDRLGQEARLDEIRSSSRQILVDCEGSVWATAGAEVVRYRGDEARRFGRDDGLPRDSVLTVLVDRSDRVWAGTTSGLAWFDREIGHFRLLAGTQAAVRALFEDRGGAIYVATDAGVVRVENLAAVEWRPGQELERPRAFTADASGRLWIAARNGIATVTVDGLRHYTVADGLAASPAIALEAAGDELWIGHEQGLSRFFDGRMEVFPVFAERRVLQLLSYAPPSPSADPLAIAPDGATVVTPVEVVAVTPEGLLRVPTAEPIEPVAARSEVHAALRSPNGTWWLGLDSGLLKHAAGSESLLQGGGFPVAPTTAIAEDAYGALWLATATGLYRHVQRTTAGGARIELIGPHRRVDEVVHLRTGADVRIRLSGPSYIGPRAAADVRFSTRLATTEEWSSPLAARERMLSALEPGRYSLEARLVTRELTFGAPARVELAVEDADGNVPDSRPAAPVVVETEPATRPRLIIPDIARP